MAAGAVGVGAHRHLQGDLPAPARRVRAGDGAGGRQRDRQLLGRRSAAEPVRAGGPRAVQGKRGRGPGGEGLRPARAAGALARRADDRRGDRQVDRGVLPTALDARGRAARGEPLDDDAAPVRARERRAGDVEPGGGGPGGAAGPVWPAAAAQPPAAGAAHHPAPRQHRARRLRADRDDVALPPQQARAGRSRQGLVQGPLRRRVPRRLLPGGAARSAGSGDPVQ